MPGNRPTSRGSRPRASSRPGRGPGRPGGPGGPGNRGPRAASTSQPPPRPRLTGRAAVLVLVLVVLAVSYASSMRAYLEQRSHLASLEADIAESRDNIEDLEREKERWDDPAFVRAQARERFGWVLPGEVAFQVIDEDGEPLDNSETLSDPAAPVDDEKPLWWQSAWRSVEVAGNPEEALADQPAVQIVPPKPDRR